MKRQQILMPVVIGTLAVLVLILGAATAYTIYMQSTLLHKIEQMPQPSAPPDVEHAIENYFAKKQKQELEAKFSEFALAQDEIKNNLHIYGSTNARFTLVTFSDLECPYCRKFHPVPKSIVDSYANVINAQFVHFPLSSHNPAAQYEAIAAECVAKTAGNKAFWVFIEDVFKTSKGNGAGVEDLNSLVADIGVNMQDYANCMQQDNMQQVIENHLQLGQQLGVSAVPTSVLMDNQTEKHITLPGIRPPESILAIVDKILAEEKGQTNAQ